MGHQLQRAARQVITSSWTPAQQPAGMTSAGKGNLLEDTAKPLSDASQLWVGRGPLSNQRPEQSHVRGDVIVEQAHAG